MHIAKGRQSMGITGEVGNTHRLLEFRFHSRSPKGRLHRAQRIRTANSQRPSQTLQWEGPSRERGSTWPSFAKAWLYLLRKPQTSDMFSRKRLSAGSCRSDRCIRMISDHTVLFYIPLNWMLNATSLTVVLQYVPFRGGTGTYCQNRACSVTGKGYSTVWSVTNQYSK